MGAALAARALVAAALVGPWLVWLPIARGPATIAVLGAVALVAAFHGWGRVAARLARRDDIDAVLAIWWGIAAVVALAGVMIACHLYDPRALVIGGLVVHSAHVALRFDAAARGIADELHGPSLRYWIVPWGLLVVLAVVHVLAAAGASDTRPFDDDGHLIAQLRRLADTGTLADPIGYARGSQLGGFAGLCGLAGAFGDVRTAHVLDAGLGFALLLGLVLARVRPRDGAGAMWTTLLILLASAVTVRWTELAPLWLAAGLVVALYVTLAEPRDLVPVALVAGAAIALRGELALPALVLAAAAAWSARDDRARVLALVGGIVAVVAPYALARALAWHSVEPSARALLEPERGALAARIGLALVAALAATPLLLLPARELVDRRMKWLAVAIAVGLGAIAGQLGTERPFATHYVWVFAIAGCAVLVIELGVASALSRTGMVLALLACVLVTEGRTTLGRAGWSGRYVDLFEHVEFVRHAPPFAAEYGALSARIPAGDTVAVWVTRPDGLDYAAHRIVDLRTPRAARLRVVDPLDRRLEDLALASRARWLVVEADDESIARARAGWLNALICAARIPWCADSLEAIALRHPVVAEDGNVRLVELR